MRLRLRMFGRIAAALALTAIFVGPAQAGPIYPDMTVFGLSIEYDGTDLNVFSPGGPNSSVISWTDTTGLHAGSEMGEMLLQSNGGAFYVGYKPLSDPFVYMLFGSLVPGSISGSAGSFLATVLVTLSTVPEFSNGTYTVALSSFDFVDGKGTGAADIYAVPEPSTLTLVAAALALASVRRRFENA